jgi:hypothetical protein
MIQIFVVFVAEESQLQDGFSGQTIDLGVKGPVHSLDFDRCSRSFAVGMGHAVFVSKESSTGSPTFHLRYCLHSKAKVANRNVQREC